METKRWWANIQLLDRQMVDSDGLMAGNVDDLPVEEVETGVEVTVQPCHHAPIPVTTISGTAATATTVRITR
jgi:hypothetical protein